MMTTTSRASNIQAVTGVLQLLVLVLGVGGLFFTIGSRDEMLKDAAEEISDLKSISSDLLKAQTLSQTQDAKHGQMLADILRRIDRLETP